MFRLFLTDSGGVYKVADMVKASDHECTKIESSDCLFRHNWGYRRYWPLTGKVMMQSRGVF